MFPSRVFIYSCLVLITCLFIASCGPNPFIPPTHTVQTTSTPVSVQTIVETSTISSTTTPTVTPEPTQTSPPPTTTPLSSNYVVQKGDTLWGIANLYGVSVIFIAYNNNITDENLIFPGQILFIPDPEDVLAEVSETGKQIVVILSLQKVYAYEDGKLIKEFVVSTGVSDHPTVQGTYFIYQKLESTRMTGPGYDLPDVPWTMYFYQGYGLHGTYWHNNFGYPMSHGCINMKTDEAKWLFNWAPYGTQVNIYP